MTNSALNSFGRAGLCLTGASVMVIELLGTKTITLFMEPAFMSGRR